MEDKIDNRIKETLSIVFGIKVELINDSTSPHTIQEWDSLNHIKMVAALEDEFSIELDQAEIDSMVNYSIIKATIAAYIE